MILKNFPANDVLRAIWLSIALCESHHKTPTQKVFCDEQPGDGTPDIVIYHLESDLTNRGRDFY
jgi:hypothetical protein